MDIANPAYDTNRTTSKCSIGRLITAQWSSQQFTLMEGGIARQLSFCPNLNITTVDINPPTTWPAWCNDPTLKQNLQAAQARLWTSIKGASSNIYSEVWPYSTASFLVADLAILSPDGTESDAIQLWSYAFLGLIERSR